MRNKYPGICYRCRTRVEVGEGHFERFRQGWRTQHATCAIECRGQPDAPREAWREEQLHWRAKQTGPKGQRARKQLREREDRP